jgi:simple sugar transport system permease protein
MADGATVFLMFTITKAVAGFGDKGSTSTLASPAIPSVHIPVIENIPVLGEVLSGYNALTYVAFILIAVVWYMLYRTPLGSHIRAVGENAEAAASVGINVKRVRYIAILISGFTAALGGLNLSMGYLTLFQAKMTNGRGFIAIAAWYLGGLHPVGTLFACLIFGLADALSNQFASLEIPPQWMQMIPYVVTILALVLYNIRKRAIIIQRAREFQEKMAAEAEV